MHPNQVDVMSHYAISSPEVEMLVARVLGILEGEIALITENPEDETFNICSEISSVIRGKMDDDDFGGPVPSPEVVYMWCQVSVMSMLIEEAKISASMAPHNVFEEMMRMTDDQVPGVKDIPICFTEVPTDGIGGISIKMGEDSRSRKMVKWVMGCLRPGEYVWGTMIVIPPDAPIEQGSDMKVMNDVRISSFDTIRSDIAPLIHDRTIKFVRVGIPGRPATEDELEMVDRRLSSLCEDDEFENERGGVVVVPHSVDVRCWSWGRGIGW